MLKVAIVVLADTETHESLGRAVNALEGVKDRITGACEFCAGPYGTHVFAQSIKGHDCSHVPNMPLPRSPHVNSIATHCLPLPFLPLPGRQGR